MKILIVVNYHPNKGGLSGAVEELKDGLEREGYECVIGNTYGNILYRSLSFFVILFKSISAKIIIANGSAFRGYFPVIISKFVSLITFKPILINFHDGQAPIFLANHSNKIRFFNKKDVFIAASRFVAECFKNYGFKSIEIQYSFNYKKYFYKRRKEFIWNSKFLWVRGYHNIYQPELALSAASDCLAKKCNAKFYFLGSGPLKDSLQKKYNKNGITFLNRLSREEILKKYEEFSVLINTSAYDNFPLSIVEAGFNEMLVISTKIGGISTIYNDDEIVFFKDKDELSEILCDVIMNNNKYDIYRYNLNKKVLSFNWESVSEKWTKVINECAVSAE